MSDGRFIEHLGAQFANGGDLGRVPASSKTRWLHSTSYFLGATLALIAISGGETALAQEPDSSVEQLAGIEEVVVTARRREESLQETPVAISAFTSRELEARNLSNLSEVGNFVPNVVMATAPSGSGGGNNLQIYIRGVGQQDMLFTTDPGVGVYVDGVYYPRTLGGVMDLLDLDRVEVLRGPQGTLFGKNTIGGAVNIISAKPSGDGSGYVEAITGRYKRLDMRGGFDVSLIEDKLFAKLSVSSKNRDGYGKRLDFETGEVIDRTGNENQEAGRFALLWRASDRITVDLAADYSRWRQESVPTVLAEFNLEASPVAQLWNALVADPYPMSEDFIADSPYDSFGTGPNSNTLDSWGVSGTVNWEVAENLGLKSITAYRKMDATFGRDGDGSPNEYLHTAQVQDQHQFSQELQISGTNFDNRLNWVAGLFYFDEFGRDTNDVRLASGLFNALEALPGPLDGSPLAAPTAPGGAGNPINADLDLDFSIFNEIRIKSYAAFGQATYDVTDRLSLTAGLRYSYEEKAYTLNHEKINSGVPIIELTTLDDDWGSFTPMGTIDFQITPEALTYFTVSRGFKSGGFNGRPINEGAVSSFDPEKVTAYEIGLKSDWFDRRLRFNLSAFYNDYTDIQLSRVSADANGVLQLVVDNAGNAEVKGVEAEVTARPFAGLDLSGAFGYLDFELTELAPGVQDVTPDSKWPQTPEWTATASAQYTFSLGNAGDLVLRGDWSYKSKINPVLPNTESIAQNGYSLFNARLSYIDYDGGWEVAVFGTNLTDKAYITNGLQAIASFGTAEAIYGRPREWGLSIRKNF